MSTDARRERFIEALTGRGGSAGNKRLRKASGWKVSAYDSVRSALIDEGVIVAGRGRGGSVMLAKGWKAKTQPPKAAAKKVAEETPTTKPGKPAVTKRHGNDANLGSPSQLTPDTWTLPADAKRSGCRR